MLEIYYEKQDGWTERQYCYLHRYLHKLFYYYKKNSKLIEDMDINLMSDETKVLIYCIIKYYHFEFMFKDYKNLSMLENTKPLNYRLVLDDRTLQEEDIYKEMNVVY